jgi:hypothetical protein
VALSPKLKVIAFDADDTLWVNEPYFRKAEKPDRLEMHFNLAVQ